MPYLAVMIPICMTATGFLFAYGFALFWLQKQRQWSRKSALTKDLMRPAGHSLRMKIAELDEQVLVQIAILMCFPLMVYSVHISQSYLAKEPETVVRFVIAIGAAVGVSIFQGRKLLSLVDERKQYTLGLEGELATGEELNQLMLEGCRVFHDIAFPYGNIDHVVVSPSGVFSVNTKMVSKPKTGKGNAEVTADLMQGTLQFPDYKAQLDIQQFETEKNWLSKELSSSVGRPIEVEPILALPGWFVKREGRGPVYVINPSNSKPFFVHNRQIHNEDAIKQIVHQLRELCRDIEPSFASKPKRWEGRS